MDAPGEKPVPVITDPLHITQTGQGLNQGLRHEKAATNRFGYGAPSPPSSTQFMNRWSHTPTPPYTFMDVRKDKCINERVQQQLLSVR
jgi:hypothetical protein